MREQTVKAALNSLFIAETYLNNEEYMLFKQDYVLRLANLLYYKGVAYKELKNFNTSLEMFASALDLYENFDAKNIELYLEVQDDELLLESIETAGPSMKINMLYELIEDLLIKMDKLKEALLVTERHRNKLNTHLMKLGELCQFEQIETILIENNPTAVIYFHLLKFNSTINCWLLEPGLGITKFHQISFKSLSSLLLFVSTSKSEEKPLNFLKHLLQLPTELEKELLLKQAYNILIKPFEANLFSWFHQNDLNNSSDNLLEDMRFKNKLIIIYDEDLITIPFHLLKFETNFDRVETFSMHEAFEISCIYSLKYFFIQSDINFNFKYIPNESEFQKLVEYAKNNELFKTKILYKLLVLNFLNDTNGKWIIKIKKKYYC